MAITVYYYAGVDDINFQPNLSIWFNKEEEKEDENMLPFTHISDLIEHAEFKSNATLQSFYMHRYEMYSVVCVILKLDKLYNNPNAQYLLKKAYYNIHEHLMTYFIKEYGDLNVEILTVMEKVPQSQCMQAHILLMTNKKWTKAQISELDQYFVNLRVYLNIEIHDKFHDINTFDTSLFKSHNEIYRCYNPKLIVKIKQIKSTTSYIHCLRKTTTTPMLILASNAVLVNYFIHFNHTIIMGKEAAADTVSEPKFTNNSRLLQPIRNKDPLVLHFMRFLQKGYYDYNEILQVPQSQSFLQRPNLRQVYDNCYAQYVASHTHIQNLIDIIYKYRNLTYTERCACPVYEWLSYQEINIEDFESSIISWLQGCHREKRNALVFLGKPNAGKSKFARELWLLFPLHTRILPDSIFLFANLLQSGCALWNEPIITSELFDQAKLVLEGESDINIPIKNRKSVVKLGKRVPIIITTNNPLHKYCSNDDETEEALSARCYQFLCNRDVTQLKWCKSSINGHYCSFLNSSNTTDNDNTIYGSLCTQNKRKRTTSTSETETCSYYHKLESNHVLTFITVLILNNFKHWQLDTNQNISLQYDFIKLCESTITDSNNSCCFASKSLENWNNNYNNGQQQQRR